MVQELPLDSRYEIDIAWSAEDEAFVARIPDLPFAGAHGETEEEALAMAKSAIRAYLDVAQELGKPIPEPGEFTRERVAVGGDPSLELARTLLIEQQRAIQQIFDASASVYTDLFSASLAIYQSSLDAFAAMVQSGLDLPTRAALESLQATNEAAQQAAMGASEAAERLARAADEARQSAIEAAKQRGGKAPGDDASSPAQTSP